MNLFFFWLLSWGSKLEKPIEFFVWSGCDTSISNSSNNFYNMFKFKRSHHLSNSLQVCEFCMNFFSNSFKLFYQSLEVSPLLRYLIWRQFIFVRFHNFLKLTGKLTNANLALFSQFHFCFYEFDLVIVGLHSSVMPQIAIFSLIHDFFFKWINDQGLFQSLALYLQDGMPFLFRDAKVEDIASTVDSEVQIQQQVLNEGRKKTAGAAVRFFEEWLQWCYLEEFLSPVNL